MIGKKIEIIHLAKKFANSINEANFADRYDSELALEKEIYGILRKSLGELIHLNDRELDRKIITHGETKEGKKRWSETKGWQDVIIAGSRNTSDIVIWLSDKETMAIQLKYAKKNITGAIQAIVGQCIIASLRHPAVIGIVLHNIKHSNKNRDKDRITQLIDILLKNNIFLIIKSIE